MEVIDVEEARDVDVKSNSIKNVSGRKELLQ
jgi:hypothetical protein